jgi:hypothetical protein
MLSEHRGPKSETISSVEAPKLMLTEFAAWNCFKRLFMDSLIITMMEAIKDGGVCQNRVQLQSKWDDKRL